MNQFWFTTYKQKPPKEQKKSSTIEVAISFTSYLKVEQCTNINSIVLHQFDSKLVIARNSNSIDIFIEIPMYSMYFLWMTIRLEKK